MISFTLTSSGTLIGAKPTVLDDNIMSLDLCKIVKGQNVFVHVCIF